MKKGVDDVMLTVKNDLFKATFKSSKLILRSSLDEWKLRTS